MKNTTWLILILSIFFWRSASAQAPQIIHYQGRLLNGTNLVNGTVGMALRLYNAPFGGSLLYEDSNTVEVVDGLYSTFIGDNPVDNTLLTALDSPSVYVEVVVDGVVLAPREQVSSVAYSLNTRGLSVDASNNVSFAPGGNSIGATSIGATIGGGTGNLIGSNTQYAVIAGGQSNRIEAGADFASIGGGNGAVASLYGQRSHSAGTHTNNSNSLAQSSEYVLRGESVNGLTNTLFLDGVAKRLAIKPKQTLVFDITVAARDTTTRNAGYRLSAMAERTGSTVYLNGSSSAIVDVPPIFEDNANWKVQLRPNSVNSSIDVEVIGATNQIVRYVAVIRATDIQIP